MKQALEFFSRNHILAILMTGSFIALGLKTLYEINRSQFPEVELGEIFVTTTLPGASAVDVELDVTMPIEDALQDVSGIAEIHSTSQENFSLIHIFIDDNLRDQDPVKDNIRERLLELTDLPKEATRPKIMEFNTDDLPIVEVGLTSQLGYGDLRKRAQVFERKLLGTEGVGGVTVIGLANREVRVAMDPEAMARLHISVDEALHALNRNNVRTTAGVTSDSGREKHVVVRSQYGEGLSVEDVIVRALPGGRVLRVGDFASVESGYDDPSMSARFAGQQAIAFEIQKRGEADIIETVQRVQELAREESILHPQLTFHYNRNAAVKIANQFDMVRSNGIIGLTLVMLVLTLFLSVRVSLWVALGIPTTLLGVIFVLPFFDLSLDTVSLTAMILVLGILVDDAIIIAESIYSKSQQGLSPVDAAVEGVREVIGPVLVTVLTTILAFVPMFFMQGNLGKFVYVVPLVICLALAVSLLESVVALPAHLVPALRKQQNAGEPAVSKAMLKGCHKILSIFLKPILHHPYLAATFALLVFCGSIFYAFTRMDFVLFPRQGSDSFAIGVEFPDALSEEAEQEVIAGVERVVRSVLGDDLHGTATRMGAWVEYISAERDRFATVMVTLKGLAERDRYAPEIVETLRPELAKVAGIKDFFFRIEDGGPPMGAPLELMVMSSDRDQREGLASELAKSLSAQPGIVDVDLGAPSYRTETRVSLDAIALAKNGLNPSDIAQTLRTALSGREFASVRAGLDEVHYLVELNPDYREQESNLGKIQIRNRFGELIRLNEVASFEQGQAMSRIHRYQREGSQRITAAVDFKQTTADQAVSRAISAIDLSRYPLARVELEGRAAKSREALGDLFVTMGLAGLAIFFLLTLLFQSFIQAAFVLVAVPFGLVGVIATFAARGESLSFLAITGIIGLTGVVVNDSSVLVNHINKLRRRFPRRHLVAIVFQGAHDRMRAILITTLSTVSGLIPLAHGIGGQDVYMGPMALALGYGLLFATPLTLLLVPALYLIGDDLKCRMFRGQKRALERVEVEALEAVNKTQSSEEEVG